MQSQKFVPFVYYVIFMVVNNFSLSDSLKNKDTPCTIFGTCECLFSTGRGINLTPISNTLSIEVVDQPNTTILLHLCDNIELGTFEQNVTNPCSNVSACFVNAGTNQSISLGIAENMTFISLSQYEPIQVQFNNGINKTTIDLTCVTEPSISKLIYKSFSGSDYNLELQSEYACVHLFTAEEDPTGGMSTGSVLVIMLLVLSLLYFGGGMLALKLLRGAQGKEMIPNVDFWTDLPYLVRDGIIFTLNGFQPPATYDRI